MVAAMDRNPYLGDERVSTHEWYCLDRIINLSD